MKKIMVKMMFVALVTFMPVSAMAGVSVHINIPFPPPIIFPGLPHLVVIPQTDVYVVPDIAEEIFFYAGWWWRPWNGRWYRSRNYDRGWSFYHNAPHFYQGVPRNWRDHYRNSQWQGHRWQHKRIPYHEIQRNWQGWRNDRYWERQRWGVQGLQQKKAPVQRRTEVRRPQPKPNPQSRKAPVQNDRRPYQGMNRR
ncbi:MAG: hypothetical protein QMD11_09965 [Smithella sp.]|nr:hypothetical protein [Smithella sp.]